MKIQLTLPLLLLGLSVGATLRAQDLSSAEPQRVVVYVHGQQQPVSYWSHQIDSIMCTDHTLDTYVHGIMPTTFSAEQIDSIKFIDEQLNTSIALTITPNPDETGIAELRATAGSDAKEIKMLNAESFRFPEEMSEVDMMGVLYNPSAWSIKPEEGSTYGISNLQRNYTYTAIAAAVDKYGNFGTPTRVEYTMPNYPIQGAPKVEVNIHDQTYTGFQVDLIPNKDVKEYFFLAGAIEPYFLGGLSIQQFVVLYGVDTSTRQGHTQETLNFKYSDFKPSTDYPLYIVMRDQNGQLTDLVTHTVRTADKGTDQEAHVSIEVKEITATSARVIVTPDENTSVFRDRLVEKEAYDSNQDNLQTVLEEMFNEEDSMGNPLLVEADDWTWPELKPDTEYYVFGRAKNAKSEWGPMTKTTFRTLKAGTQAQTQSAAKPVVSRIATSAE